MELASTIAARAPLALREAKRIINRHPALSWPVSDDVVPRLMGTAAHAEGITAFREGRQAEFGGG